MNESKKSKLQTFTNFSLLTGCLLCVIASLIVIDDLGQIRKQQAQQAEDIQDAHESVAELQDSWIRYQEDGVLPETPYADFAKPPVVSKSKVVTVPGVSKGTAVTASKTEARK